MFNFRKVFLLWFLVTVVSFFVLAGSTYSTDLTSVFGVFLIATPLSFILTFLHKWTSEAYHVGPIFETSQNLKSGVSKKMTSFFRWPASLFPQYAEINKNPPRGIIYELVFWMCTIGLLWTWNYFPATLKTYSTDYFGLTLFFWLVYFARSVILNTDEVLLSRAGVESEDPLTTQVKVALPTITKQRQAILIVSASLITVWSVYGYPDFINMLGRSFPVPIIFALLFFLSFKVR